MKFKVLTFSILLTLPLFADPIDKKSTDELIQIATNPNSQFKKQAIQELGIRNEATAFQSLKRIVENKNEKWITQTQAIDALAASKKREAFDFLYAILKNPDNFKEKRATAAKALNTFKNPEVIPLYLSILKSNQDPLVTAQVLTGLEPFPNEQTVQGILDALQNEKRPFQRMALIEILGKWRAKKAADTLNSHLKEEVQKNGQTQLALVQAISLIGAPSSREVLLEALKNTRDKDLILQILTLFSTGHDPSISDAVIPFLKNPDKDIQFLSIYTLGELGNPKSAEALDKLYFETRQKQPEITRELLLDLQRDYLIVNALRKIYPFAGTNVFFEAVKPIRISSDLTFHLQAKSSIDQLREAAFEGLIAASNPKVPELIIKNKLTKDPSVIVRKMAVMALGSSLSPMATKALIDALSDPDAQVRWTAAQALGKLQTPESIDPLIELLNDPHPQVQIQAIESLSKLPYEKANDALKKFNDRTSIPKQVKEVSETFINKRYQ